MNIDKLNMANLVGEVMDKVVEFYIGSSQPKMSLHFAVIMMSKFHISP